MALFKDGLTVIGANTGGGYLASAKYVSDTKLELMTTGSYIRVYGLKY